MGEQNDRDDSEAHLLARLAAAPPVTPELPHARLKPGDRVGESYRVEGTLGRGGMGVVYRARDLKLDRSVALKLHTRRTSASAAARLVDEAKAMAKLSHPNVLTVYEVSQHELAGGGDEGQYCLFIAMELVEGTTLAGWLGERERSWREVTRMFVEAGQGLAAAHRADVVHRDFKPDNVLIDASGRPRVADFGIARFGVDAKVGRRAALSETDDDGPRSSRTATGVVLGTRAYMAPEQAHRQSIDARADQYAFCVSLFEGLHGHRPDDVTEPGSPESAGRRIPRRLQLAVQRGMAVAPDDRFASMDALLGELSTIVAPRRGSRAVVLGVGALSAVAVWTMLQGEDEHCKPSPQLDAVWSDARGAAVERALREGGGQVGAEVASRVRARLDLYATRWGDAYRDACAATYERRVQSQEAFDLRVACLERRREEFETLSERFLETVPETAARADEAVLALSSLAPCGDVDALRRVEPVADSDRDRVLAVRGVLARAKAARNTGGYEEALRLAEDAIEQAESLRYWGARALALESLAEAHTKLGQHEDAAEVQTRAMEAALRAGDEPTALRVAVAQAYIEGYRLRRPELGRRALGLADAWLDRLDAAPMLMAHRRLAEGYILREEGRLEDARVLFAEASSQSFGAQGDEALEVRRLTVAALAVTLVQQGRLDEAIEAHLDALELVEAVYGPVHPSVANELNNLGAAYLHRGDFDEAAASFLRAREIMRASLPPEHPQLLRVSNNLAGTLTAQGRGGEAIEVLEDALQHSDGAEPQIAASLHLVLATSYVAEGRIEDARSRYALAYSLVSKSESPGSIALRISAGMSQLENTQGQFVEAEAFARRGLEAGLASDAEGLDGDIGNLRLHLGDALQGQGESAGACQQYELALEGTRKHFKDTPSYWEVPLRYLAECRRKQGEHQEALTFASQAVEANPEGLLSRLALVRILWAMGKHGQARQEAERALDVAETREGRALIADWLADHPPRG